MVIDEKHEDLVQYQFPSFIYLRFYEMVYFFPFLRKQITFCGATYLQQANANLMIVSVTWIKVLVEPKLDCIFVTSKK